MTGETKNRIGLKPVWITAGFLVLTLSITVLLFKGMEGPTLISSNILVLTLININIILVTLLVLLLSRNLIKLYFERRRKLLGSRFRAKLIAAFVGLALIPSILLFIVASGLLTSSIENWFSVQVERSLDDALQVAQSFYQKAEEKSLRQGGTLAVLLSESPQIGDPADRALPRETARELLRLLARHREEQQLTSIGLYNARFQEWAKTVDPSIPESRYVHASADLFEKASSGKPFTVIRATEMGDLVRGITPVRSADGAIRAYLVVDTLVPQSLVNKMEEITKSFEDYKQLQAFKNPIKGSYILSFFIIVLLIIFSATWFGFYLARGITVPIQRLAEGTEAIAKGDLDFRIDVAASDEIGTLVDSFNKMTGDLRQSKDSLIATNRELEERRAYIEQVLQTIATGVISINGKDEITTFNRSAERILGVRAEEALGEDFATFLTAKKLAPLAALIEQRRSSPKEFLEEKAQIETPTSVLTLHIILTPLQGSEQGPGGLVMVFDDLSELLRAQKVAAWQEVARRIAHEIKNPLTPIQLSAQRLRKHFLESSREWRVPEEFRKLFDESTQIIVSEVNGLKTLVDEFSNYARMPSPRPSPQDINAVLREVAVLYQGAHKDLEVTGSFAESAPRIQADRDQMRRVFVNLFENAVEAMNHKGKIRIATFHDPVRRIYRAEISDEGVGIPPEDIDKLFLPYFSKKRSGTGLGLAIVNRIVSDHNGQIRVKPNAPRGTTFVIELPA
jgi:two-component system nitrogen regulation sensor histidine kinase NtrY